MASLMRTCVLCLLLTCATGTASAQSQYVEPADVLPEAAGTRTVAVDQVVGTGEQAIRGRFVVIHYEGWVHDLKAPDRKGLKFDSSRDRGQTLSVLVGVNRMITGLDRGILGMRVGGKRTLLVPPKLGYGTRLAYGDVPPNSTLLFEVELFDVVPEQNVP